ncbi:hypothetical protein G3M48_001285 [Beauveria asiatica]|uniref:Uncharacterized protein n=1 Tax=Beauveria asiatica TaxID=1069075 RepID=A0AAW0RZB6_9HYPO
MAKARGQWNGKISDRVQATSTVLNQLKDIKAMGLSHSISEYLQEKRKEEVIVSLRERQSRVIMFATFNEKTAVFNLSMTPVIVLAGARFWTWSNPTMTAAEIFSAYSVILTASEPLDSLLESKIMWASSYACITRIERYLSLPELEDVRQVTKPTRKEDDSNGKLDKLLLEKGKNFAIRMEDVMVRSGNGRDILKSVNLSIPPGSLSLIHGTVGSGKSVFLQTHLATAVFSRLFEPGGFLRRRGTTVIMTTNKLDFLPAADIVLEMKGDGAIDERRGADMPSLPECAPSSAASASADTCGSENQAERTYQVHDCITGYQAGPLLMSLWILGTPFTSVAEKMPILTQDGLEVEHSVRFNMYPFDGHQPTDESILETLDLVGLSEQIVLLDEATSSMDYGVDQQIQKLADEQLTDCTIDLIVHRVHSLDNADVVVKLEAGRVVEVARRSQAPPLRTYNALACGAIRV